MWASQYWKFDHPYTWVNSKRWARHHGLLGAGRRSAPRRRPTRPHGLGGRWRRLRFQMTAQELVTASTERIPVKVAILNNAYLGMVRQWQMFYEESTEVYRC